VINKQGGKMSNIEKVKCKFCHQEFPLDRERDCLPRHFINDKRKHACAGTDTKHYTPPPLRKKTKDIQNQRTT
jgi:hypothetical protein